MKRVLKYIGGAVGLLILTVFLVSVWIVRRAWPQVNGTIQVQGLSAPVTIERDEWGVPYIYAENDYDLIFAQGYAHAQDRLWQMYFIRGVGRGVLSENLGEATVDFDRYMRTFGLKRAAEQDWEVLDEPSRELLQAYADGVNVYTAEHPLPVEFTIFRVDPEPWTPIDTLIIGKLMGWQLSGDYGLDILRAQTIAALGPQRASELFPFTAEGVPLPPEVGHYEDLSTVSVNIPEQLIAALGSPTLFQGSNSWVVSGDKTASGKPLLADDTHLGLNMPSIWYMNGLQGGNFNVTGFSLVGVPLVIIGYNQNIAWGPTNLSTDLQEVYIERLDDRENPTQYEFEGKWRDLEITKETIYVSGGDPVDLVVYHTHHGPIINDVELLTDAPPLSLQWTDFEGSTLFRAVRQMNMAANWEEFHEALRYWSAPKESFIYADKEGNIGYQAVGHIPIRMWESEGVVPVPGWTGTYEWVDYLPFEEMPSLYNPPEGYIVAANSRSVPPDEDALNIEYYGIATYRPERILQLLSENESLTLEDFQTIQADVFSLPAQDLVDFFMTIEPQNERQVEVMEIVSAWDQQYTIDSVGASIVTAWRWFLQRDIIEDELGEDMTIQYQRYSLATLPQFLDLMAVEDNPWFDDVTTPEVERRDDMILRSLEETIAWFEESQGMDITTWQWGNVHTMTFVHQPLGQLGIAPLNMIFNSTPVPAPGSSFTVNNAWFRIGALFHMEGGPSQRFLADLSDLNNSLAINSTGQSEHIFHAHREDMIPRWVNTEYLPLLSTEQKAETEAVSVLVLTP